MKKRILITDDDEDMQDIYKTIFERKGYEVEVVGEANKIFENNYTIPDLFLLDRQLRGHDGLNVCKFLRDQPATKDIPVIIVSSVGNEDMVMEGFKLGADDFLKKPIMAGELIIRINRLIAKGKN